LAVDSSGGLEGDGLTALTGDSSTINQRNDARDRCYDRYYK